jgi:SulP family sulfate permease
MIYIRGLRAIDGLRARIRAYDWATYRELFTPKLVTALRRGYSVEDFRHDFVAGLTVAILALPLSMAIAIGAGVTPDKGLITAVVAGLLISALGGSRFQVGGPAAAFIVVVAAMLFLAPLAYFLALPCLAAVLLLTAWRLLEPAHVARFLSSAPWDDRMVLAATLLLTVFVDLGVAISVGVVMAAMLFMHRMAEMPGVQLGAGPMLIDDVIDGSQPRSAILSEVLPEGVRVVEFHGPLFFGASARLDVALKTLGDWPKVIIMRMREVPLIDSTGIDTLDQLARDALRQGCRIIMSGLQPQPREALHRYGFLKSNRILLASNSFMALEKAKALIGEG